MAHVPSLVLRVVLTMTALALRSEQTTPKRLLSLKWQALILISLILVLINGTFYLLQSASLEATFNRERDATRGTHLALFEGLLIESESRLAQIGELVPLLKNMGAALVSQNKNFIERSFDPLWPSLQFGSGIDGMAFFGITGDYLAGWGDSEPLATKQSTKDWANSSIVQERPLSSIECRVTCTQYVMVPLLSSHRSVGTVLLSTSLAEPIIQFSELTRSDIAIMISGNNGRKARYLPQWDLNFVALTRMESTWPIIQAAAQQFETMPELGKLEIVNQTIRRHEIILFPLTRLAADARGYFMFSADVEDTLQRTSRERNRALAIGILGLLLSEVALLAVLWSPLSRLRRTAKALPALAKHDFNRARRLLGPMPVDQPFFSEIDQVEAAAITLTQQLEQLNDVVEKRTSTLRDNVLELARERDFIDGLLNTAQVIILTLNENGLVRRYNQYALTVSGYAGETLSGKSFSMISRFDVPVVDNVQRQLGDVAVGTRKHFEHESALICKDGTLREIAWIHSHLKSTGDEEPTVLSVGLDITARRKADQSIAWLASHDALTGLFNRHRFQTEFDRVLGDSRRHKRSGAILFIDLDHFKYINDTLGHGVGDMLLKTSASEIRRLLRESDVVARFGGDEFVVLLAEMEQADAVAVAHKINNRLRKMKFSALDASHRISASIGIAMFYGGDETAEDLLKNADVAMYHVKETRRGDAHVYSGRELLRERLAKQLYWKNTTERALATDQFVFFYQPIFDIANEKITHYEALLRLFDKDGTYILPQEIVVGAEKSGLIRAIDHLVLTKAIESLESQRVKGKILRLAVNLSASAFSDPEILPHLKQLLTASPISADQLIIEITETAALSDFSAACSLMNAMRSLGCRFALDDFGAGFSSFYYLKQLPVDYVKIDGGFIQSLARNRDDQILVKAISDIAKGFGKLTIAEFVEDAETLEILRSYGVDYAQGYFLGKPGKLAA